MTENPSNPSLYGAVGNYGGFGVCPFGTTGNAGELMVIGDDHLTIHGGVFPYCSDEIAMTRHTCNDFLPPQGFDQMKDNEYVEYQAGLPYGGNGPQTPEDEVPWNSARGFISDIDLGNCHELYDVDDYARDWSDFIGLSSIQGEDTLLPTIFTIGFGLKFDRGDGTCDANVADCLGEQFLRYLADVGDNNRLDNDFSQAWAEGAIGTGTIGDFGERGPCQLRENRPVGGSYDFDSSGGMDQGELVYMYGPLPPQQNCGHYFNAPNADELEIVFDAIASRMFTRLAG